MRGAAPASIRVSNLRLSFQGAGKRTKHLSNAPAEYRQAWLNIVNRTRIIPSDILLLLLPLAVWAQ
eukprot:448201-Pyramimonas_sp.AAC.1